MFKVICEKCYINISINFVLTELLEYTITEKLCLLISLATTFISYKNILNNNVENINAHTEIKHNK